MDVQFFDSFDDMMEEERRAREAADARVQPWQAAIKPGDYFRRGTPYGFNIYGEVLPEEEPREPFLQHYRLCMCYSVACVEGEVGDVHVSVIERLLSQGEFETARQASWHE